MAHQIPREIIEALRQACRIDMQQELDSLRAEFQMLRERCVNAELKSYQQVGKDEIQHEFDSQRAEISNLREELSNLRAYVSSGAQDFKIYTVSPAVTTGSSQTYLQPSSVRSMALGEQQGSSLTSSYMQLKQSVEQDEVSVSSGGELERDRLADEAVASLQGKVTDARQIAAYRDIMANAAVEHDLACDCWGATIFVLIKDLPLLYDRKDIKLETVLRFSVIVVCMFLNLICQSMLVYFMAWTVMVPNVKSVQMVYREYHRIAFNNGQFDLQGFDSLGDKNLEHLCSIGISSRTFLCICLFLWALNCFNEFRLIWKRVSSLCLLPQLPANVPAHYMVYEVASKGEGDVLGNKNMVVCMCPFTNAFIYIFVLIPRFIITLSLLVMGTAFITSSSTFENLILNSLAMTFIFDIDELLFVCFLPRRLEQNIQKTKLVTPTYNHRLHVSQRTHDQTQMIRAYRGSAIMLIGVVFFLSGWYYFQAVLPGYEFDVSSHCAVYRKSRMSLHCLPFQSNCFPKG